jgi:hypothetical protein
MRISLRLEPAIAASARRRHVSMRLPKRLELRELLVGQIERDCHGLFHGFPHALMRGVACAGASLAVGFVLLELGPLLVREDGFERLFHLIPQSPCLRAKLSRGHRTIPALLAKSP